jgi:TRAP-type mannitol/chloroaromatic compound transport system substrate-binding protein
MINLNRFILVVVISIFSINIVYAKPVKWRIAQSWPENFPLFSDVVRNMAKNVDVLTNGEFKIEIVSKEQHKGALKVFDWVKDGEYEMAHTSSHYWTSKDFNTAFFTAVPMGMITNEKHAWFYYGGGIELMQKVYSKYNLLAYPGGNSGNQMGGWFTKEVKTLADFQGLRMRVPGLGGQVLKKLGAKILKIPGGELYAAMRDGKLDSMEFVGPALDYERKYHEVANYYYTGWHSPGAELQFLVNKEKFATLSPQFQAALTMAMNQAAYNMNTQTYHQNAENLATIFKDHPNVKIRAFPRQVYRAFGAAMNEILADRAASGDELTKEIIESRQRYLTKVRQWTRISDQAFLNNVLQ